LKINFKIMVYEEESYEDEFSDPWTSEEDADGPETDDTNEDDDEEEF